MRFFAPLLFAFSFAVIPVSLSCSGYKISYGGKTMMGANEDAWRLSSTIWFEIAGRNSNYGAAFTGSRLDGKNGVAPQAGMNEQGLAFQRLASWHPDLGIQKGKRPVENQTAYLKMILHTCKTVAEVGTLVGRFDRSCFREDVFLYTDKSGDYLIVEPYKLIRGCKPSYVISNFCPSITTPAKAAEIDRYRKGAAFLQLKSDSGLAFCKALSDTMHVCRKKIGDGTLLTSIWDLKQLKVNLFFYHDYGKTKQFSLPEELKKGDHQLAVAGLFPPNPEFQKLKDYQIPKNNAVMGATILGCAGIFILSFCFFILMLRKKTCRTERNATLLIMPVLAAMTWFIWILLENSAIFYFPAPYRNPVSMTNSLASYFPDILLLLLTPLSVRCFQLFRKKAKNPFFNAAYAGNLFLLFLLSGLFVYWQLFVFATFIS